MNVTPEKIKELRERTGIGVGKCKEALEESKGDIELAISNLRKAGMATAVKKEGRATNEGQITTAEHNNTVAVVEINAETDFVVRNENFQAFARELAKEAATSKPTSVEAFKSQPYSKDPGHTIDQARASLVQSIGENIQIRRLKTFTKGSDSTVGVYSHGGGKIVCVVEIHGSGSEQELAKEIAMHIAAAAPEFVSPEQVPASIIQQEKDIAQSQIKGKPENMIEKILVGKMNAYYDAVCLLRQKYIKNDKLTISDLVQARAKEAGKPLTVTSFIRWAVGQGKE